MFLKVRLLASGATLALCMTGGAVFADTAAAAPARANLINEPHANACAKLGTRDYTFRGITQRIPSTTVSRGSRNACVYYLQELLTSWAYWLTVDGIFGAQTQNDVIDMQRKAGIAADGIVGPNTWSALQIIN